MYTINKNIKGCRLVGEFIKNGKRYKIYHLPSDNRYIGLTLSQVFDTFDIL
jgi:hypothetical protein